MFNIFIIAVLIASIVLSNFVSSQQQHSSGCLNIWRAQQAFCPNELLTREAPFESTQGAPGKRGAKGEKGEQGVRGPRGIADREWIADVVREEVRAGLRSCSDALSEANERIKQLEESEGLCPVKHDGTCFWVEVRYEGIRLEEAGPICAARGGKPAVIYSESHYDMITRYMRSMIAPKTTDYINAWLGLTYRLESQSVHLSNGTAAPYVKWYTGYPVVRSCCSIILYVKTSWSSSSQNMRNVNPPSTARGVVCEK